MAESMDETQAFALVKQQKLCVVNLHEDETGVWFANIAPHFRAPMVEWRTGRSKVSAADALVQAIGFVKKQAAAVKASNSKAKDREDLI